MELIYKTNNGFLFNGDSNNIFENDLFESLKENINLIFTSPPFPLNKKKAYGNLTGEEYIEWLTQFGHLFKQLLTKDGSFVIELGNAWEKGQPTMSTLPLEALLTLKKECKFYLCQEFIWFNPARLPSPAQWVNIERIRVKDAFTRLWWFSNTPRPKANNRNILSEYSPSMKRLLKRKNYNSGLRPSEHRIGEKTFLKDNKGAIPPNVITISNTSSKDPYLDYCKKHGYQYHPARMPVSLAEFFIEFLTEEEDIVFDPFAGSNITGLAAENLNRKWYGVEKEKNYAISSIGRFENAKIVKKM